MGSPEIPLRLVFFFGIFFLVAIAEFCLPRRKLKMGKKIRWANNLGLTFLNAFVLRFFMPVSAMSMAVFCERYGWGIFHQLSLPSWLSIFLSVILLDGVIYLQHVMFHSIPLLWRLHMVHHADLDIDVSTGLRFHTLEMVVSMGIKIISVALLGAPVIGVLIFEIVLNATSMFNHANLRLPEGLDRVLRLFLVTPDMHRVHHSILAGETNSNFGFNLPWWDYFFGTYQAEPSLGHTGMTIGLKHLQDPKVCFLHWILLLPFIGKGGSYPINRRQR